MFKRIVIAAGATFSSGFVLFFAEPMMPPGDWRWLVLAGICLLVPVVVCWKDIRASILGWKVRRSGSTPETTVDYIGAGAIVDRYIEPAMRDKPDRVLLAVRKDFLDRFEKTTGAKVGPYEYNGQFLHQWMQSNAARFLVEHRGNML